MKPTASQIKYATDLLRKLGYDVVDYATVFEWLKEIHK
jgi:hypothetical protein